MNRTFLIAGGTALLGAVAGALISIGVIPTADDFCDDADAYCLVVSVDNQTPSVHVNIDDLHKSGVGQIRWSIAKKNRSTYKFKNDAIVFDETNAGAGFDCPAATDGIYFLCKDSGKKGDHKYKVTVYDTNGKASFYDPHVVNN